jgi:hypothetical protein
MTPPRRSTQATQRHPNPSCLHPPPPSHRPTATGVHLGTTREVDKDRGGEALTPLLVFTVLRPMGAHPHKWRLSTGSGGSSRLVSSKGGGLRPDLAGLGRSDFIGSVG